MNVEMRSRTTLPHVSKLKVVAVESCCYMIVPDVLVLTLVTRLPTPMQRVQGEYAKATPLYQRAQAIDERVYGPDHPVVATDLNNWATLLEHQVKPLHMPRNMCCFGIVHGPTAEDVVKLLTLCKPNGHWSSGRRSNDRNCSVKRVQM